MVTRVFVTEGNRMRHEMPDGMVSIISGQTALTLFPQSKTAIRMELNRAPGEGQERDAKADLVQALRELGRSEGEPIGEKTLAGKPVVGFRSKVGSHLMTVWADKETAMPVRVEMALKWGQGEAAVVMDQFQIDPELDDSLFSIDPPAGYRLTTEKLEMPSPKNVEEAVIDFLRESADLNDNVFPASLHDVTAFAKATKAGDLKRQRRLAMLFGTVTAMTSSVEHGYAGKGVKPGEKDKVIFWYRKDAKSPTWRAIFGDLRVEDVTADKLPATQPVAQ
jgi:outer membrane lipoprotein-sorting protein